MSGKTSKVIKLNFKALKAPEFDKVFKNPKEKYNIVKILRFNNRPCLKWICRGEQKLLIKSGDLFYYLPVSFGFLIYQKKFKKIAVEVLSQSEDKRLGKYCLSTI